MAHLAHFIKDIRKIYHIILNCNQSSIFFFVILSKAGNPLWGLSIPEEGGDLPFWNSSYICYLDRFFGLKPSE